MRIGLLTGGGDCAGLNAALRGAAQCLLHNGVTDLVGFEDGFLGLLERRCRALHKAELDTIIDEGGTILGSCNKATPLNYKGTNRVAEVQAYYAELGLDGIITLGGDGTMSICADLSAHGMRFIGVPKTIDNDIVHTEQTFGFDSAVSVVMEAIDRLHTTARSHHRTMIVETMGRYAGWIALYAGVAGNADVILLPEMPFSVAAVAKVVNQRSQAKRHTMIVVAEGAKTEAGEQAVTKTINDSPDPVRLGGIGLYLQAALEPLTDCEIRTTSLGHVQRGGAPTAADRILATSYGYQAAELALAGRWGRMVCLQAGAFADVALTEIAHQVRQVPAAHPVMKAARACGISFGSA